MAAAVAAALLLRGGSTCRGLRLPVFSAAAHRLRLFQAAAPAACPPREGGGSTIAATAELDSSGGEPRGSSDKMGNLWGTLLENKRYRDKEAAILKDIEPIRTLTKEILHSERYRDGERLSGEDEKAVVENLLVYHPHSEDKIGCGIDCIMVDRHPRFRNSRCLFVVRTDGIFIDFSYQKCLREYVRVKYPTWAAERFIREHFKRT
ncbi:hypothetical protein Taro_036404 [Colocasia esculenta]|uniref:DCL protein n=1 Tax=Colocasia esculenta TaxID=4460 RepID=A0A843W300_COLES|nr:hypothetical protein [Colocasia esculenta]